MSINIGLWKLESVPKSTRASSQLKATGTDWPIQISRSRWWLVVVVTRVCTTRILIARCWSSGVAQHGYHIKARASFECPPLSLSGWMDGLIKLLLITERRRRSWGNHKSYSESESMVSSEVVTRNTTWRNNVYRWTTTYKTRSLASLCSGGIKQLRHWLLREEEVLVELDLLTWKGQGNQWSRSLAFLQLMVIDMLYYCKGLCWIPLQLLLLLPHVLPSLLLLTRNDHYLENLLKFFCPSLKALCEWKIILH